MLAEKIADEIKKETEDSTTDFSPLLASQSEDF